MDLKRAAEGLTVIAVGAVLLGNTLGYLPWSVWWNVLSLWPLLIVAAGVDIIGRGTDNTWLRVLSSLLVVGGLLYGALVMPAGEGWFPFVTINGSSDAEAFDLSEPHDGDVERGVAVVSGGLGDLTVGAGRDLVSAEGETPFRKPRLDVSVTDGEADVTLAYGEGTAVVPTNKHSRMELLFDKSVVWDLTLEAGVTNSEIDLSDLDVSALLVDAGVSDTTITLGRISSRVGENVVPVQIEAGVSTLKLRIPKEAQVRLIVKGGLSAIDVDGDLDRLSGGSDKRYESAGFDDGDAFYDIAIDAGVGAIDVELY